MKYFILNIIDNKQQWIQIQNPRLFMKFKTYKFIKLYDDELKPIGIGMY